MLPVVETKLSSGFVVFLWHITLTLSLYQVQYSTVLKPKTEIYVEA